MQFSQLPLPLVLATMASLPLVATGCSSDPNATDDSVAAGALSTRPEQFQRIAIDHGTLWSDHLLTVTPQAAGARARFEFDTHDAISGIREHAAADNVTLPAVIPYKGGCNLSIQARPDVDGYFVVTQDNCIPPIHYNADPWGYFIRKERSFLMHFRATPSSEAGDVGGELWVHDIAQRCNRGAGALVTCLHELDNPSEQFIRGATMYLEGPAGRNRHEATKYNIKADGTFPSNAAIGADFACTVSLKVSSTGATTTETCGAAAVLPKVSLTREWTLLP